MFSFSTIIQCNSKFTSNLNSVGLELDRTTKNVIKISIYLNTIKYIQYIRMISTWIAIKKTLRGGSKNDGCEAI